MLRMVAKILLIFLAAMICIGAADAKPFWTDEGWIFCYNNTLLKYKDNNIEEIELPEAAYNIRTERFVSKDWYKGIFKPCNKYKHDRSDYLWFNDSIIVVTPEIIWFLNNSNLSFYTTGLGFLYDDVECSKDFCLMAVNLASSQKILPELVKYNGSINFLNLENYISEYQNKVNFTFIEITDVKISYDKEKYFYVLVKYRCVHISQDPFEKDLKYVCKNSTLFKYDGKKLLKVKDFKEDIIDFDCYKDRCYFLSNKYVYTNGKKEMINFNPKKIFATKNGFIIEYENSSSAFISGKEIDIGLRDIEIGFNGTNNFVFGVDKDNTPIIKLYDDNFSLIKIFVVNLRLPDKSTNKLIVTITFIMLAFLIFLFIRLQKDENCL